MGSRESPAVRVLGLSALLVVALATACKPSRSPREAVEGNVTGRWTAESRALKYDADTGGISWVLELEELEGGRMKGRGSAGKAGARQDFDLGGRRDAHRLVLDLDLRDTEASLVGSLESADRITAEIALERDTVPVTFTRP